nr:MAG TPA: hypothetical protein [Caudoviricetes sp.]
MSVLFTIVVTAKATIVVTGIITIEVITIPPTF